MVLSEIRCAKCRKLLMLGAEIGKAEIKCHCGHVQTVVRPPMDIIEAHQHSIRNKEEVSGSLFCGCFYCKQVVRPEEITEWHIENDGKETAICPFCGVDAIISSSINKISLDFLEKMHEHYF